ARMDWATASTPSCLRLETTTRAPKAASARATASPMPLLAPVIMATLPVRSNRLRNRSGIRAPYWVGFSQGAVVNNSRELRKTWPGAGARNEGGGRIRVVAPGSGGGRHRLRRHPGQAARPVGRRTRRQAAQQPGPQRPGCGGDVGGYAVHGQGG